MKKLKPWNYLVPIIMFLVAAFQYYQTTQGLSRWKGGGFGMYSEIGYHYTEIWIDSRDTFLLIEDFLPNWRKEASLIQQVKKFPKEPYLKQLYATLEKHDKTKDYTIEIWLPKVDLDQLTFTKTKIHAYTKNDFQDTP